ncbi:putative PHD type zinc finger protein with BAH domain-containing protein [Coemansia sp. RSA 552]|nr:putative PHD type zinc finger protein with BAH domain-containing protein [Coemansia sp. RSA 552]
MTQNSPLLNSDRSLPPPPTTIVIAGGATVAVDDYVYIVPPQPDEPYIVARVMEFLYVPHVRQKKPTMLKQVTDKLTAGTGAADKEDVPTQSSTPITAETAQLSLRWALFQRTANMNFGRMKSKDARTLTASMKSEVSPVTSIRGKCFVRHSSEIGDLNAWKSRPDHFYYTHLFDFYMSRTFEIIPVSHIRNAPQEVLEKLQDTYEFIFAESQKINDLVSTRRACTVCAKWCSISESIKCSMCERNYHLQCLDPPPTRKPAKGYGWQCAACLRRNQEKRAGASEDGESEAASSPSVVGAGVEVGEHKRITRNMAAEDSFASQPGTPLGNGAASSDTETRSGSNKRLKLVHGDGRGYANTPFSPVPRPRNRGMWPFRYFGVNTEIEDVLHDDQRIYPRAVSRIGPKYQAIIPAMVSPAGPGLDEELLDKKEKLEKLGNPQRNSREAQLREEILHAPSPRAVSMTNGHKSNEHHTSSGNGGGGRWGRDGGGGGGGGGGGMTRWQGKSAEQMDRKWDEIEVQRGNHNAELFFRQPGRLSDTDLDMYMEAIVPFLRRHFAGLLDFTLLDCQDAALHGLFLHRYDVEEALISIPDCPEGYTRAREAGDFWTREGLGQFNEFMREYGSDLQSIHESLPVFTRRAVTLRYYLQRPTELGRRLLDEHANNNHVGMRRLNLGQGESATNTHLLEGALDAGFAAYSVPGSSGAEGPPPRTLTDRGASRCFNCHCDSAVWWYPSPQDSISYNTRSKKTSTVQRVMCGDCHDYWVRYGTMPGQDAINARKNSSYAAGRAREAGDEAQPPRRARGRPPLAATLAKARAVEAWPMIPCDVCQQSTSNSPDMPALRCRECGLCVHYACSGYPEDAVVNPKRWKCGICTNIHNPTVSINYACILCRKAPALPHAGDRPARQMMWRTKGNNWVHPLCALAVPEAQVEYSHGNVVVGGTAKISEEAWRRQCTCCLRSDGATVVCAEGDCDDSAHAMCATPFIRGDGPLAAGPAKIFLRLPGDNNSQAALLADAKAFVADGGKAALGLKCHRHAQGGNAMAELSPDALDASGRPVMWAVIVTKMAGSASTSSRGALLRSSISHLKHQHPLPPPPPPPPPQPKANGKIKANGTAASPEKAAVTRGAEAAKIDLPSPEPSPERAFSTDTPPPQPVRPDMVAWSSPADDPKCTRCSASFSPIWWPVSPGSSSSSSPDVLCHRCYSAHATASVPHRSNVASS